MKQCTSCGQAKNLSEFNKQKSHKDGLRSHCRDCQNLAGRKYHNIRKADNQYRLQKRQAVRRSYEKNRAKRLTYTRKIWQENREQESARSKKWRNSHPEQHARNHKHWAMKNKTRLKEYRFFKAYGITLEQKEEIFNRQNRACVICGTTISPQWHMDHSHKTNTPRGVLCGNCNVGLGMFRDSIQALAKAIQYLENYSTKDGE